MRKITISKWKGQSPEGNDVEDSTLLVFNVIINNIKPEEMPRGLDSFRLFKRLSKAFEDAEKSGTLELEESDYSFLKGIIERGVPAIWAMNNNISNSVEAFLNAKEE